MGSDYWKRGKLCIECKNFKSNIKYCIFDCSRVAAGPELWAKYFLKTLISPQICWPHVSRVSKVHRLPDLRSVYPRSSGNNNNLNSNQPVRCEDVKYDTVTLWALKTDIDTLAEVPARPHMKWRVGSRTLPPSSLAGQQDYWGPLITLAGRLWDTTQQIWNIKTMSKQSTKWMEGRSSWWYCRL